MSVSDTDRDINNLSDNFKLKVVDFLKEVWDIIFITEGFRSDERQAYLYNKIPKVTWVKHSNHQDWNAIDIAFRWDELYPKDHSKWEEIWNIAKKHGIDWGFYIWDWIDKPHFQDNWQPYKKQTMEKYWKEITRKWFTYPKSVYWIPVRLAKTTSKTLMWMAYIKWYYHKAKKDEILIFENSFKYWQDYLFKILQHEASHFLYHKYYTDNQKEFVEWLFNIARDDVFPSGYSKTTQWEFCSEIIWYWETYIKDNIPLPKNKNWTKWTQFIYGILEKFNISALKKHTN